MIKIIISYISLDPMRCKIAEVAIFKPIYRDIPPRSGIGIIYVFGVVDFPHYIADETLLRRIIADGIL